MLEDIVLNQGVCNGFYKLWRDIANERIQILWLGNSGY